jgi:hypothetical protein
MLFTTRMFHTAIQNCRRTPLQNANETTPKSPKIMSKSISPKIRTKLNFSENVGTPSSNLSSSSNLQEDVEPSLDAFLDADFDIILVSTKLTWTSLQCLTKYFFEFIMLTL